MAKNLQHCTGKYIKANAWVRDQIHYLNQNLSKFIRF